MVQFLLVVRVADTASAVSGILTAKGGDEKAQNYSSFLQIQSTSVAWHLNSKMLSRCNKLYCHMWEIKPSKVDYVCASSKLVFLGRAIFTGLEELKKKESSGQNYSFYEQTRWYLRFSEVFSSLTEKVWRGGESLTCDHSCTALNTNAGVSKVNWKHSSLYWKSINKEASRLLHS